MPAAQPPTGATPAPVHPPVRQSRPIVAAVGRPRVSRWSRSPARRPHAGDRGSQTMEYALLLIVAGTVAMLALTWARQGAIKSLLDAVMDKVLALFGIGKG
jgi:hypothetical protein